MAAESITGVSSSLAGLHFVTAPTPISSRVDGRQERRALRARARRARVGARPGASCAAAGPTGCTSSRSDAAAFAAQRLPGEIRVRVAQSRRPPRGPDHGRDPARRPAVHRRHRAAHAAPAGAARAACSCIPLLAVEREADGDDRETGPRRGRRAPANRTSTPSCVSSSTTRSAAPSSTSSNARSPTRAASSPTTRPCSAQLREHVGELEACAAALPGGPSACAT